MQSQEIKQQFSIFAVILSVFALILSFSQPNQGPSLYQKYTENKSIDFYEQQLDKHNLIVRHHQVQLSHQGQRLVTKQDYKIQGRPQKISDHPNRLWLLSSYNYQYVPTWYKYRKSSTKKVNVLANRTQVQHYKSFIKHKLLQYNAKIQANPAYPKYRRLQFAVPIIMIVLSLITTSVMAIDYFHNWFRYSIFLLFNVSFMWFFWKAIKFVLIISFEYLM